MSFSSCRAMRRDLSMFCHCIPPDACIWCIEAMGGGVVCGAYKRNKALDAVGKAITGRSTDVMTRELPDVVIVRPDP